MLCSDVVPPGTPSHRVVVEVRQRRYPARPRANLFRRGDKEYVTDDRGGTGTEIAREVFACPACARDRTG